MVNAQKTSISAVGKDQRGRRAEEVIRGAGIDLQLTAKRDEPTGYVTVKLSNGEPDFSIHQGVAWDHIERLWTEPPEADLLYFGSLAQRTQVNRATLGGLLDGAIRHRLLRQSTSALLQRGNPAGRVQGGEPGEM